MQKQVGFWYPQAHPILWKAVFNNGSPMQQCHILFKAGTLYWKIAFCQQGRGDWPQWAVGAGLTGASVAETVWITTKDMEPCCQDLRQMEKHLQVKANRAWQTFPPKMYHSQKQVCSAYYHLGVPKDIRVWLCILTLSIPNTGFNSKLALTTQWYIYTEKSADAHDEVQTIAAEPITPKNTHPNAV